MITKTESRLFALLPISLITLIPSLAFGMGLVAIKEQPFHDDAGANIVVYSKLQDSGVSVKIETKTQSFTIEPQKIAGKIEVISALPASITTDTELEPLRKVAKEYQNFSTRFPKSVPILAPQIIALDNCIKEFEGGKGRYNGKWMPKEEALATKQKEEETNQSAFTEATQEIREKIAFNESQKAKGLVKWEGKWLPADEVRRLEAQLQATLKQQTDAANERRKAEEEYESDGLVLLLNTVSGETDDWGINITGTVVNSTDRELKLTMIEYKLYDASDAQIGTATAFINDLEAGGRWNFKAHSFIAARHYKLSKLSKF